MHNCTVTNALIRCSDNELGPSSLYPTHTDPVAWDLIHQYAVGMMSLPDVETALSTHLGDHYVNTNWEPVLKAIMESEDDESALDAVATHRTATQSHSGIKICIPARQLASAEAELMESVCWLKERNRIHGPLPSVDNVVEPPEERDLPEPVLDGSVGAIADEVCREAAIANGEIADEVDSTDTGRGWVGSAKRAWRNDEKRVSERTMASNNLPCEMTGNGQRGDHGARLYRRSSGKVQ